MNSLCYSLTLSLLTDKCGARVQPMAGHRTLLQHFHQLSKYWGPWKTTKKTLVSDLPTIFLLKLIIFRIWSFQNHRLRGICQALKVATWNLVPVARMWRIFKSCLRLVKHGPSACLPIPSAGMSGSWFRSDLDPIEMGNLLCITVLQR